MKTLLTSLLGCSLATATMAAAPASVDTLTLNLADAVALALDESFQARALALDLEAAGHDVDAARGRFRTRADLDLVLPELEERVQGVTVPGELPRYDTYGHREFSARLSVTQPLPTDGEVSLSAQAYQREDTVYDSLADQEIDQSTFFNSYEVSLSQPLLQPNGLTEDATSPLDADYSNQYDGDIAGPGAGGGGPFGRAGGPCGRGRLRRQRPQRHPRPRHDPGRGRRDRRRDPPPAAGPGA